MKTTRKLLAFVMVIAMVMAMAVTASAATETVTIQNAQAGTTYTFYQILSHDGTYYQATTDWESLTDTYFNYVDGYVTEVPADGAAIAAALKGQTASKTVAETVIATAGTNTVDLEPGYYLMISTTDGDVGDNASLVAVTGPGLTIREKNTSTGLPTIEKTMTPADAYYRVGDEREFTINIMLDEGDTKYTITDIMTGLELDGEITVTDVPHATKTVTKNGTTGFTVEYTFEAGYTSQANTPVTITYKAKVTEAGVESFTNNVNIKNQGNVGPDAPTVSDSNSNYTITKTDGTDQIEGAEFALYAGGVKVPVKGIDADSNGSIDYYRPVGVGETADDPIVAGQAVIKGLETGTDYVLQETKAPVGYEAITGDAVTFKAGTINSGSVVNTLLDPLPETGGMGTTLFYTLGSLMVVAAAALLVTKKRMEVK